MAVTVAVPLKPVAAVNVVVLPLVGLTVPALLGLTDHVGLPAGKLAPAGQAVAVKLTEPPAQTTALVGLTLATPTTVVVLLAGTGGNHSSQHGQSALTVTVFVPQVVQVLVACPGPLAVAPVQVLVQPPQLPDTLAV